MIEVILDHKALSKYKEIIQWCMIEFEVDHQRWTYSSNDVYKPFGFAVYFRDESDAMAFKLRWV